ncbi:hypothetical protein IWW48_003323 [Coemansia sp. RSA 1200]|nr:hypothetical protein IWW48_003323 [Coemansia sp. RSA 1200]
MPHSLVSSDTRRLLNTSHWIAPSMPAKLAAYNPKPRNRTAIITATSTSSTATATATATSTSTTLKINSVDSTGRVDKRKRRRPIRSLPAPPSDTPLVIYQSSGESTARTSCTLRMPYLDDYQRNPTAYSRALMGTAHLLDDTADYPSTASTVSSSSKGYHVRRAQSSTPVSSKSFPMPMSLTSSPSPISENSVPELRKQQQQQEKDQTYHQQQQQQQQQRRNATTLVVRRLFPSLDDDTLATLAATAAAQQPPPPPSSLQEKKKRSLPGSALGGMMVGEFHSADASALMAGVGSIGTNRANGANGANGASMQTPQTINNGNDTMFVGDKLGREIFRLHPQANSCPIKWTKAAPMDVTGYPLAEFLSLAELDCCSILRLHPEQYLAIKHSLVRAGRTMPAGTFKKRDAQKLCRVDVNKTSKVFEWFCKLGWIPQAVPKLGGFDYGNEPHYLSIDEYS